MTLSPADIVWLQRLPHDPSAVTHADASRVADMAAMGASYDPSSRHLIESIWSPIRDVHDLRAAQAELELAEAPLPPVPSSAPEALSEAVKVDHPDWPAEAIDPYADKELTKALTERRRAHEQRRAAALQRLERLHDATTSRNATTRTKESVPAYAPGPRGMDFRPGPGTSDEPMED